MILVAAPSGFIDVAHLEASWSVPGSVDRTAADGRHIFLADHEGGHRLWLKDVGTDPLAVLIPLDAHFPFRLEAALRFKRRLDGEPAGPSPRRLKLTAIQRSRLVQMLRAADGRSAGASYRDIAAVLMDPAIVETPARDWKSSALHSRMFRLVKDAKAIIDGGYRRLLNGDWP